VIESPEIRDLIVNWFNAIQAGVAAPAADAMLSWEPGFVAIGDQGEWLADREGLLEAYRTLTEAGPPEIRVLALDAYSEGTVGWAADAVLATWNDGRRAVMRHTFVLHQELGEWRVVHAHYSAIPSVSNFR
jgi:ketosteroid isomerase-like protein